VPATADVVEAAVSTCTPAGDRAGPTSGVFAEAMTRS
jgi:hypothetical protein